MYISAEVIEDETMVARIAKTEVRLPLVTGGECFNQGI